MTRKTELPSLVQELETVLSEASEAAKKKVFVEPELSSPIDVLEATTFFQLSESSPTN